MIRLIALVVTVTAISSTAMIILSQINNATKKQIKDELPQVGRVLSYHLDPTGFYVKIATLDGKGHLVTVIALDPDGLPNDRRWDVYREPDTIKKDE